MGWFLIFFLVLVLAIVIGVSIAKLKRRGQGRIDPDKISR